MAQKQNDKKSTNMLSALFIMCLATSQLSTRCSPTCFAELTSVRTR